MADPLKGPVDPAVALGLMEDDDIAEERGMLSDYDPQEFYVKLYVAARNLVKLTQKRVWYPSQRRLALLMTRSLLLNEGREIVCEMTRQFGKSQAMADIVYALSILVPTLQVPQFREGFRVGIFGPKREQSLIIFGKIKDNFENPSEENQTVMSLFGIEAVTSNGKEFRLTHSGRPTVRIVCETASEGASIEGLTADLLILDECQDISEMKITKSIVPMAANTNGTRILIGTPNFEIGYLYKAVQRNIGKDNCLIVPYDIAIREKYYLYRKTKDEFHLRYKKFIDRERRILGEDSDAFRTQFKLEWITERTRAITVQKLEELMEVTQMGEDGIPVGVKYTPLYKQNGTSGKNWELPEGTPVYVGIDLGKMIDATVVSVVGHWNPVTQKNDPDGCYLYDWLHLPGENYEDQYDIIADFLKGFGKIEAICLDATGVGAGPEEWFQRNYRCYVIGLKLTAQVNSDLYTLALQEMNNNRFWYPGAEDSPRFRQFLREWIGLEKEYKGNLLKCENNPDDKYAHDDFCDSLAFAFYAMYQPGSSTFTYIGALNEFLDAGKPTAPRASAPTQSGSKQTPAPAIQARREATWDSLPDDWYSSGGLDYFQEDRERDRRRRGRDGTGSGL